MGRIKFASESRTLIINLRKSEIPGILNPNEIPNFKFSCQACNRMSGLNS